MASLGESSADVGPGDPPTDARATEHRAARIATIVWVPLTILYVHDAVTSNWGWSVFALAPLGWVLGLVSLGAALASRRDRPLALVLAVAAVGWFVGASIGASSASGC